MDERESRCEVLFMRRRLRTVGTRVGDERDEGVDSADDDAVNCRDLVSEETAVVVVVVVSVVVVMMPKAPESEPRKGEEGAVDVGVVEGRNAGKAGL